MIIDSHAHLETRLLDVPTMIDKIDQAGVDRVVLIPAMNDPLPKTPERLLDMVRWLMQRGWSRPLAHAIHRTTMTRDGNLRLRGQVIKIYARPDNQTVVDMVSTHPDRFLGWIFLNPSAYPDDNPRGIVDELDRYLAVDGMVGIKLHPHWHDYPTTKLTPLLTRANELGLPVLIHLGFGPNGDFRALCQKFPRVRFIAAHAGFPFYQFLWKHGRDLPNLYVDLSSPYIDERLARGAVSALSPHRCLYGTDAPYGFQSDAATDDHHDYDYTAIRGWIDRLPVSESERDAILGATALELLRVT